MRIPQWKFHFIYRSRINNTFLNCLTPESPCLRHLTPEPLYVNSGSLKNSVSDLCRTPKSPARGLKLSRSILFGFPEMIISSDSWKDTKKD